jgi:hypothetical protein
MRIGYARVSTDIAARRLFGLAADPAVAIPSGWLYEYFEPLEGGL